MRKSVLIGLLCLLMSSVVSSPADAQCAKCDGGGIVSHEPIPRTQEDLHRLLPPERIIGGPTRPALPSSPPRAHSEPYDTYSLFLIPSHDWGLNSRGALPELHQAFVEFSHLIGSRHLAVWFAKGDIHGLDMGRSMTWCDRLGWDKEGGPYVATMRKYPDDLTKQDKVFKLQFNQVSASRVIHVLRVLAADLRDRNEIHEIGVDTVRLMQIIASILDKRGIDDVLASLVVPNPH